MMKNYKFILITLSFLVLVGFIVVTYLDIPAPDKLQTKIIDVNDEKINITASPPKKDVIWRNCIKN